MNPTRTTELDEHEGGDAVAAARDARRAHPDAEFRAGGIDTTSRQVLNRASGPFVDLADIADLRGLHPPRDGQPAWVGATTTLAELHSDPHIRTSYPGLAAAVAEIATPEVRSRATIGGNLLQRNRCPYYRSPDFDCHQTGADQCPAHEAGAASSLLVNLGPCVAPHPSTIALALLAHDATVLVDPEGERSVPELLGDGTDPTHDHQLAAHEILTGVRLPAPPAQECAAYHRLTRRSTAEWPLVETLVRLGIPAPADQEGTRPRAPATIRWARVAVGGVARVPLRLRSVEDALLDRPASAETVQAAAGLAGTTDTPCQTLVRASVLEALERAMGEHPHS
ncbi:FAD binding domain-containing protein [Lipingzhangella sp. LS1_29]|uniref:FAD binding domain-containing protein n=1 Tax=Lipingzhangella rawalii TaxID=2055835 RepID=A0ABU2H6W0_9ACTN|nr:FAD binding domain-containing protein [Lipingzhangella rawalii]MDS1271023.1 FAD binding domain-containing protein [Lipingzhangella rawalii]